MKALVEWRARDGCPESGEIVRDRMTVIRTESAFRAWLDRVMMSSTAASDVLSAALVEGFHYSPVSAMVNSPTNDKPECMMQRES